MKKSYINYIYLVITMIAFSSYEVTSKMLDNKILPIQLNFIRFLIGGIFLLLFSVKDLKKRNMRISKKDVCWMIVLGFLFVSCSMNLMQYGIKYSTASISAVLFCSNPIFVSLIAGILGKEKLTGHKMIGLTIGIIGVLFSFLPSLLSGNMGENFKLGAVFIIISLLSFSVFTVLGKGMAVKYGSLTFNAYTFLLGSITLLPFFAVMKVSPFAFEGKAIIPQLLYLGLFVTGIAYWCFFKAMEKLDASICSMVFFVKAPLASIIAAMVINENITWYVVIGMIVTLIGMYIANQKNKSGHTQVAIDK